MTAFAFYLLKVIICSGILFLYYLLALRNRSFHQWNRFYLLTAVVLSLVLPFLQFTIYSEIQAEHQQGIQVLQVVGDANQYLDEIVVTGNHSFSMEQWLLTGYAVISCVLFLLLVHSLLRILRILNTHRVQDLEQVKFIETQVAGTPFSFFQFIFWNRAIDIHSENGRRIFEHELVHVRERHTLDRIFMQLLLAVFWINPFFWLMRRELKQIHEFIADKRSVGEHGASAFAAMILQSAYPKQYNVIASSFFQTSIKRRLAMLNKTQKTSINYFSRIAALLIVILTVLAFSVRSKKIINPGFADKPLVVVIDAGHGEQSVGNRTGAFADGYFEDDIVLAIAKKIQALNTNDNIRILLTRPGKELVALQDRVAFVKEQKADLLISLHTNAEAEKTAKAGLEIVLPNKNPGILPQSQLLGSAIHDELESIFKASGQLMERTAGVYILNFSPCPAVLVECGFLTNEKDRKIMIDEKQQENIALRILNAINRYSSVNPVIKTSMRPVADTLIPSMKTVEKNSRIASNSSVTGTVQGKKIESTEAAEVVVMGYKTEAVRLVPSTISDKEVVVEGKPLNATVVAGYKKVDTLKEEARIDKTIWRQFLSENLSQVISEAAKKGIPAGNYTVMVRFLVHEDGSLSGFSIVKDPGYDFGKSILGIMHKSPKWIPAKINSKPVASYFTQPVTLVIVE